MSDQQNTSFWLTPKGFAGLGLIGAVTYFLLMEHREHLFQFLPFLIFLLCPLMHLFMHGGHGHGHGDHEGNEEHEHHHATNDEIEAAYRRGLKDGNPNRRNEED